MFLLAFTTGTSSCMFWGWEKGLQPREAQKEGYTVIDSDRIHTLLLDSCKNVFNLNNNLTIQM